MKRVLLSDSISPAGEEALRREGEVVRSPSADVDTLRQQARDVDGILIRSKLPEDIFDAAPRVRGVVVHGTGTDLVPIEAATAHGVMVANSPRFCSEEVSDHAAMLILACARKLPHQVHAVARHGWDRPATVAAMGTVGRLRGKTLGFVAFGRIARLTAEKLAGFGMRYLAHDPYLSPADVARWNVELVSLDALCRQSDFVSMHALLNSSTRGFFGEAQFRAMKPTAFFVNTSRGATVNEAALIRALREGWIAGAGLDVVESEPAAPDNPLLAMSNVLITPHTAGYGQDAFVDNRRDTVDEVARVLGGGWPTALVNPAVRGCARAPAPKD